MKDIKEVKEILQRYQPILKEKFKVEKMGIFGSFTRGKQKEGSDLDILVEFSSPVGLFTFLELEGYLKKRLGVDVDLVTEKALKPGIGRHILGEVVPI